MVTGAVDRRWAFAVGGTALLLRLEYLRQYLGSPLHGVFLTDQRYYRAWGLRIAAGLAVIGAVVGEFVGAFAGEEQPLGLTILSAMRENRTDLVFAAIAMAAAVGFLLFGAVSLLGWVVLRRWHDSAVRSGA